MNALLLILAFALFQPTDTVVFVGDSITASHYPEIAAKMLHTKLYRYAVKGADTRRISKLLDKALKIKPTHVVIFAGINDCVKSPPREAVSEIYDRIMKLASRVLDAGAVPVIVAPYGLWKRSTYLGVCAESLEFMLRDGVTTNMVLVETRMDLSDPEGDLDPQYDAGDGLHLNYKGQKRLAELVVKELKEKP
jgi:lysophospholipase L1-like esterase